MKRYKCRLTTTHIDLDGDRMMLSALENMVSQINERYIPMGVEHDPRIPPMGRLVSAELVELEDGEFAVDGIAEVFEPGDAPPLGTDKRGIPFNAREAGEFAVQYDRGFQSTEDQKLIFEIAEVLGVQAEPYIKKSLDPVSVLTIGGGFILGAIATGFLNQLGADVYNCLKLKLKRLFGAKHTEGDVLLSFEATVEHKGIKMNVEVLASNPTPEDIDRLLDEGLKQADEISGTWFDRAGKMSKLVCEYRNGTVNLRFGVRRDCVPLRPVRRTNRDA